jgi:hypothetical protein
MALLYFFKHTYEQNEKPDTENVELFSKKRIIPGRLQSAMSLESLPSMPDENGQSFDSGMDIDDGNDHIHRKHSISTNDGDSQMILMNTNYEDFPDYQDLCSFCALVVSFHYLPLPPPNIECWFYIDLQNLN